MKQIKLSTLIPGTITDAEYCTQLGEVLLTKGVTITQNHLDILTRRNIFELFIRSSSEEEELQQLLSKDFKIDDFDFDEKPAPSLPEPHAIPELGNRAKALDLPEFKMIRAGEEGLEQLGRSKKAEELDKKFKLGKTADRPVGPALKDSAREITPSERTDIYKKQVVTTYDDALNQVKYILNTLANGEKIDGYQIRKIAEVFVEQFVTDKNILLNMSLKRSDDTIYVYNHSLNVCLLAINIAASFGYSKEQIVEIGMGALLYDVGMLLVPKEIYTKKVRLNKDELFEIQKHPILGLHLLESVTRLPESIPFMAYQSHERENATGYPKRRGERFIHFFSKIIQIADIYVALSSPRPYREELIPYKAMESIIKMTKQGLVSGEFVKAFLCYTSLFPVGSLVELNDGRIAKVIHANGSSFAKPSITVLTDPAGAVLKPHEMYQLNLSEETNHHIVKALKSDYLSTVSLMDGF